METALVRKPFQGVYNIIRFNWHFYFTALLGLLALTLAALILSSSWIYYLQGFILLLVVSSLVVSWYVYDRSGLYEMEWLKEISFDEQAVLANIHAGFDETSYLLQEKFPNQKLLVYDFYDPIKHTEWSIRRARNAYPPFSGTHTIQTHKAFLPASVDGIFLIFSAHEIRDEKERKAFFQLLVEGLSAKGRIIVVEHLRDLPNFLAYHLGFFHFHSLQTWKRTFSDTGLQIRKRRKLTPFVNIFILEKNGTAS